MKDAKRGLNYLCDFDDQQYPIGFSTNNYRAGGGGNCEIGAWCFLSTTPSTEPIPSLSFSSSSSSRPSLSLYNPSTTSTAEDKEGSDGPGSGGGAADGSVRKSSLLSSSSSSYSSHAYSPMAVAAASSSSASSISSLSSHMETTCIQIIEVVARSSSVEWLITLLRDVLHGKVSN